MAHDAEDTARYEPLLARVAAGDGSALRACIERHGRLVGAIARRMSPTPADAEDAVQEVFLDVWRNAGRFDPDRSPEPAFIAMLARRRLIDRHRRSTRLPEMSPIPGDDQAPATERVEEGAMIRDDAARVNAALGELDPVRREVIELSFKEGHSHERIAERLGLPLGTVKSHARRGLLQLREHLSRASLAGVRTSPTGGAS